MHIVRRFLVATLVPALIVAIFAVGGVAAHGPSGKVELCHWANHKFVSITVSMNAMPAHLSHGDVEPDQYGDCSSGQQGDEKQDGDSDQGTEADESSQHESGDSKTNGGDHSWHVGNNGRGD